MLTLVTFFKQLVPKPSEKKPLICQTTSQFLKSQHQRTGLDQRAVSIKLYGTYDDTHTLELALDINFFPSQTNVDQL